MTALSQLVQALPAEIDAAIYVVLHIPPHSPSLLADILAPCTRLPVLAAVDGAPIRRGHIVVATADRHLMVDADQVRVTRGPKECRARPSVDVLFRSAAATHGERVIGVVLTGMLDDGTAGLWAIKDRGGVALVQDPNDAEYSSMPESALSYVSADAVVPIAGMAEEIMAWLRRPVPRTSQHPVSHRMEVENRIAREGNALQAGSIDIGKPSVFTCPDCHGALAEINEGPIVRFRCHTGHAFSPRTLLADVNEAIDHGLWDTLRAVEERILLLRRMEAAAMESDSGKALSESAAQIENAQAGAESLRALLMRDDLFAQMPKSPNGKA